MENPSESGPRTDRRLPPLAGDGSGGSGSRPPLAVVEIVDGPAPAESLLHLLGTEDSPGSDDWNWFEAVPKFYAIRQDADELKIILKMPDLDVDNAQVTVYGGAQEGTHDFVAISGKSSELGYKHFAGVRLLKDHYDVRRITVGIKRGVVRLIVPRAPIVHWPFNPQVVEDDFFPPTQRPQVVEDDFLAPTCSPQVVGDDVLADTTPFFPHLSLRPGGD